MSDDCTLKLLNIIISQSFEVIDKISNESTTIDGQE